MRDQKPLFVGIAGGSGSGKTHLARHIADRAGEAVSVIGMDQYFRTEHREDPAQVNFDHPGHLDLDLLEQHIRVLRNGVAIRTPMYDFRTMTQTAESMEVHPTPVVLVEGLFILAQPFVSLLDLTCFLDVSDDQRLLGRIVRDVEERGATLETVLDRYQRFVRPSYHVFVAPTIQNADVVVDFTYRRALFTNMVAQLIRDVISGHIDVDLALKEIAEENSGKIASSAETFMPMSVDIRDLARTFPETVTAAHVPRPLMITKYEQEELTP